MYEYKIRSFIARCRLLLLFIQFEMLSARNCAARRLIQGKRLGVFLAYRARPIRRATFGLCFRYAEPLHRILRNHLWPRQSTVAAGTESCGDNRKWLAMIEVTRDL